MWFWKLEIEFQKKGGAIIMKRNNTYFYYNYATLEMKKIFWFWGGAIIMQFWKMEILSKKGGGAIIRGRNNTDFYGIIFKITLLLPPPYFWRRGGAIISTFTVNLFRFFCLFNDVLYINLIDSFLNNFQ